MSGTETQFFRRGQADPDWQDPLGRRTISINLENQQLTGAEQDNHFVPVDEADCVTSRTRIQDPEHRGDAWLHAPVIDLDLNARLIPSTTPGHFHLYLDRLMSFDDMMMLLRAFAAAGLVEQGYVEVTENRRYASVRLPWVSKVSIPELRCCRCNKTPEQIEEYVLEAERSGNYGGEKISATQWCWENEGTMNRKTGRFACTQCYIEMGQPSGPSRGQRWTP